jgi:hypothetical protein
VKTTAEAVTLTTRDQEQGNPVKKDVVMDAAIGDFAHLGAMVAVIIEPVQRGLPIRRHHRRSH